MHFIRSGQSILARVFLSSFFPFLSGLSASPFYLHFLSLCILKSFSPPWGQLFQVDARSLAAVDEMNRAHALEMLNGQSKPVQNWPDYGLAIKYNEIVRLWATV